jgi:hypothetical protein
VPLGNRLVNVYSHSRSGNPPPAPQSGSEIRRSVCSASGALRGAIGVFRAISPFSPSGRCTAGNEGWTDALPFPAVPETGYCSPPLPPIGPIVPLPQVCHGSKEEPNCTPPAQ